MTMQRVFFAAAALIVTIAGAGLARAQFTVPSRLSDIVERLTGSVLSAQGAPTPEPGDQLAVFFGDQILGVHSFQSTQTNILSYDILIFGDDPATTDTEGPAVGQSISFRFFDSSTNTVRTDVAVLNNQGEVFNLTFQGELTFTIPINVPGAPPFPDAPARMFDVRLGATPATPSNPGAGSSGAGSSGAGASFNLDVDGDGKVSSRDAAVVIRLVIGAGRGLSSEFISRADVNGDGVVDTKDAIEIIRNK